MRKMQSAFAVVIMFYLAMLGTPAQAGDTGKATLFVNLTAVDPHRVEMALNFSEAAVKRGHGVTVFLNIDAVRIAEKDNPMFEKSRAQLERVMKAGARVIVCPHCLHYAGLQETDLISGAGEGNPDLTMGALFAPDTRVMTW